MNTDVFHFDDHTNNFNDLSCQNGFTYWYARDYMKMLGYASFSTFKKAINKSVATCTTLDIIVVENFEQITRQVDGEALPDLKLSGEFSGLKLASQTSCT